MVHTSQCYPALKHFTKENEVNGLFGVGLLHASPTGIKYLVSEVVTIPLIGYYDTYETSLNAQSVGTLWIRLFVSALIVPFSTFAVVGTTDKLNTILH